MYRVKDLQSSASRILAFDLSIWGTSFSYLGRVPIRKAEEPVKSDRSVWCIIADKGTRCIDSQGTQTHDGTQ
jgi:hypothetical protein